MVESIDSLLGNERMLMCYNGYGDIPLNMEKVANAHTKGAQITGSYQVQLCKRGKQRFLLLHHSVDPLL